MNTKFPNLLAALDEAIAAFPDNVALRAHRNWLLAGRDRPVEYRGLRLVGAGFEPIRPQAELAAAQ